MLRYEIGYLYYDQSGESLVGRASAQLTDFSSVGGSSRSKTPVTSVQTLIDAPN